MMKTLLPLRLNLSLLFTVGAFGALSAQSLLYVSSSTGNDANPCLNAGSPCLTIGAALSKAPVAGGVTINIAAGTYTVSATVNINKPNITLDGAGASSTTVQINNANNAVFRQSSNGLTISDLTVSSSVATLNAGIEVNGATSGLTVENVEFNKLGTPTGASNGTNGSGIRILNSFSTLSVKNSKFISAHQGVQSGSSGIACVGVSGNGLNNITVQSCEFQKLFIGFWSQVPVDGLTVQGNTFDFEVQDGYSGSAGIYMGDLNGAIKNVGVSGNTFTSYTRGIYIFNYSTAMEADSKVENIQINNNTFTNSVWSSAVRLITQNNSTMEEIGINDNFISQAGNSFTKSLALIDLRQAKAPTTAADDNIQILRNCITFSGGAFSESTWGILLRGRGIGAVQILNNSIQGNSVGGQSSPELDAYPIPPTSGIVIQTQFEGTGISSDFGSMSAAAEIAIANNYINGFDAANGYGLLFYKRIAGLSIEIGGIPAGARIFVQENHLEDNTYTIATGDVASGVVSGKSNWYGSDDPNVFSLTILDGMSADYYSPALDNGFEEGDTNDPNCGDGFQPKGSCCCGN